MTEHYHTWQEILSQPQVWLATLRGFVSAQSTLEEFLDQASFDHILVAGCGSTHYLAQTAATTLTHCTDISASAFPSSELWLVSNAVFADRTLLLAISRSGTTTETLRALRRFRESNDGPVLAVTCYPESTLAQQADFVLAAPAAQEQSVAQTRSFTSMFMLIQALVAALAHDEEKLERLHRLPDALTSLVRRLGDLPQQLGENRSLDRFFFLGGGPFYGLANEAMLKTKEMSLSYAEAYHPLEFRHGPMSMVNQGALVVGLLSDAGRAEELRVLADMKELGASTLALSEDDLSLADSSLDYLVEMHSGLGEWERGPLYLPILQRLAYHRAIAKGLNPDQPHNLTSVVRL